MIGRAGAVGAWAAALLLAMLQTALQSFPSAFEPQLRDAFGLHATGFALVAASFQVGYIPAQLAAGMLLDRFRVERVLLAGALGGAALAAAVAVAPTAGVTAGLRALSGIAGGG